MPLLCPDGHEIVFDYSFPCCKEYDRNRIRFSIGNLLLSVSIDPDLLEDYYCETLLMDKNWKSIGDNKNHTKDSLKKYITKIFLDNILDKYIYKDLNIYNVRLIQ